MLMAKVGTRTKRDELAMNKCRLEIRGSSVLQTIPCSLVRQCELSGQPAGQRKQITVELILQPFLQRNTYLYLSPLTSCWFFSKLVGTYY